MKKISLLFSILLVPLACTSFAGDMRYENSRDAILKESQDLPMRLGEYRNLRSDLKEPNSELRQKIKDFIFFKYLKLEPLLLESKLTAMPNTAVWYLWNDFNNKESINEEILKTIKTLIKGR